MRPAAILWDNDGVLVDTEILYFEATRSVLAEADFELTQELFVEMSLRQGRSVLDLLSERLAAEVIEDMRQRRNRLYGETVARGVRVNAGVRECLAALHSQMRMGIVTGSRRDHFETMHRTTDLLRYFEFCLTHDEYTRSKPHPEPYLLAVDHLGLHPSECVVIEDSERGLESAVAAGLRCVAIPNDLTRGGDFSAATVILESAADLPRTLEGL